MLASGNASPAPIKRQHSSHCLQHIPQSTGSVPRTPLKSDLFFIPYSAACRTPGAPPPGLAMSWFVFESKDMPCPRECHSMTAMGRSVYMFGGNDHRHRFNDLLRLDAGTMEWETVRVCGEPPSARSAHSSSALLRRYVFIFGGWDGERELGDAHLYDTRTHRWMRLEMNGDMPNPRHFHATAAVGPRIYLYGGFDGERWQDDLHVLDTRTMTWRAVEVHGPRPSSRASHSWTRVQAHMLLLFGGYNGDAFLDDAWLLHTDVPVDAPHRWERLQRPAPPAVWPTPRSGHTAVLYHVHDSSQAASLAWLDARTGPRRPHHRLAPNGAGPATPFAAPALATPGGDNEPGARPAPRSSPPSMPVPALPLPGSTPIAPHRSPRFRDPVWTPETTATAAAATAAVVDAPAPGEDWADAGGRTSVGDVLTAAFLPGSGSELGSGPDTGARDTAGAGGAYSIRYNAARRAPPPAPSTPSEHFRAYGLRRHGPVEEPRTGSRPHAGVPSSAVSGGPAGGSERAAPAGMRWGRPSPPAAAADRRQHGPGPDGLRALYPSPAGGPAGASSPPPLVSRATTPALCAAWRDAMPPPPAGVFGATPPRVGGGNSVPVGAGAEEDGEVDERDTEDVPDAVLMFGGRHAEGRANDVLALATDTLRWIRPSVVGSLPRARKTHAAAVVGHRMYMFGGHSGKECMGKQLHVLDLEMLRIAPSTVAHTSLRPALALAQDLGQLFEEAWVAARVDAEAEEERQEDDAGADAARQQPASAQGQDDGSGPARAVRSSTSQPEGGSGADGSPERAALTAGGATPGARGHEATDAPPSPGERAQGDGSPHRPGQSAAGAGGSPRGRQHSAAGGEAPRPHSPEPRSAQPPHRPASSPTGPGAARKRDGRPSPDEGVPSGKRQRLSGEQARRASPPPRSPESRGDGDVAVVVQGLRFHLHGAVLRARCPFFRAALGSGMVESQRSVVRLPDMELPVFRAVGEFIYTGLLHQRHHWLALELMVESDRLGMNDLRATCRALLEQRINADSVCAFMEQAHACNLQDLKAYCMSVVLANFGHISSSGAFCALSGDLLREVLLRRCLRAEAHTALDEQAVVPGTTVRVAELLEHRF